MIDYHNDNNEPAPYPKTSKEIDRDRIEESKEYIETQMQIRSRNFETADNIDEENKEELLKSVIDPLDSQYGKDDITPSDYTRDDNKNSVQTCIEPPVLKVTNDIISNNNEINDEVIVTDIKVEPEPVVVEETPTTLTEILTGQNEVEDIYIVDEDVLQETYETIFTGYPAFSASTEISALPAPFEVIAPSTINQNDTAATDNTIPMGWFPDLELLVAPPLPPLQNSVDKAIPLA